jgi:sugar lactone lactonase YvrE
MTRTTCFPLLLLGLAVVACERPAEEKRTDAPFAEEQHADSLTIADGFATPESVLHDPGEDVYFVSNIHGDPLGRTGDGFISRVRPDGTIEAARWVDGAADGVTLHAPKGLALKGDTLFVADIDTVRAFHRRTGESLGGYGVPGATFLNGLAVGPDGTLYISDSGLTTGFAPSGTDAVHAIRNGRAEAIARGDELARPNGLVVDGNDVIMVPFGSSSVFRIAPGQPPQVMAELPAGELDGIVRLDDGSYLISSWAGQAIYRLHPDGRVETAIEGVQAPADIGYDAQRHRVLIPLFMDDRVEVRTIR